MRFTVLWDQTARDKIVEIWLESANRQAVADAADQIDRQLRDDPELKGKPFDGDGILVNPLSSWSSRSIP